MLSLFWDGVFIKPLTNLLIFLTNAVPGHDLGIAIIILTVIIRLVLYPLSKKAIQNQRALQAFQPELDKIKEKYKDDKDKQSKETLAFYQKHKILESANEEFRLSLIKAVGQVIKNGLKLLGIKSPEKM